MPKIGTLPSRNILDVKGVKYTCPLHCYI